MKFLEGIGWNDSLPVYVTRPQSDGSTGTYSMGVWAIVLILIFGTFSLVLWSFITFIMAICWFVNAISDVI